MSDNNNNTINIELPLDKLNKKVKFIYDQKNQYLIEIKTYNLNTSNSSILASIYFEYRKKINLLPFNSKLEAEYLEKLSRLFIEDILKKDFDFNNEEIQIIMNRLLLYDDISKLMIITSLKHLTNEKIITFLNKFEKLNSDWKINKYDLTSLNNFTLYFLLEQKWVKLINKILFPSDKNRKYIVDYINVLKNDLSKSNISQLLKWENKKEKWLNNIGKNMIN